MISRSKLVTSVESITLDQGSTTGRQSRRQNVHTSFRERLYKEKRMYDEALTELHTPTIATVIAP